MASKKKQRSMMLCQEGADNSATDPAAASAAYRLSKLGLPGEARMEQVGLLGKPKMFSSKEGRRSSGGAPAKLHPSSSSQSDNLPPESDYRGIRVILDNNSMWNEFFKCRTEMILTKQGSRMFPYCRFRISGLNPSRMYCLIMDIQPVDNSRYKWTSRSWQVAGKALRHIESPPFAHPESPSMGQHWMQNPVSFYKLKLTNNISDTEGNAVLHPLHRYLPRLHVVQTDKAANDVKLHSPNVVTFTFPQTEFIAVTAYQNSRFAQLKVDYNPFAKGLKEDGSSSWGLKQKLNSGKDAGPMTNERHPVKKSLKSLLANHKPKNSKAADNKASADQHISSTSQDQSTSSGKTLCSSRPAQKLFSELIREAHVSLQRCDVDRLSLTSQPTDTQIVRSRKDVPPVKNNKTTASRKADQHLNSLNCTTADQNTSLDSNEAFGPESPSKVNLKQHKRPAPLPLPALARFLRQHSSKSKKAKSRSDCADPELQSELNIQVSGPAAAGSPGGAVHITRAPVEGPLLFPSSDQPHQKSSSPPDTHLPSHNTPAAQNQSHPELPDPECSSLCFETLSPASSPEPLPALPAILELELDSAASLTLEAPEDARSSKTSTSVFKWHTVLPLPESFMDASFSTFQPSPLPLLPVTPPLLPSQTTSEPDPDQSLPFPAELSPLALQLPLSPTFSSLDGDGLSPTPSLADLVHFFSTDDDLGLGVEFSNTEAAAIPCPPPTVEVNVREMPRQAQPAPAIRTSKRKKSRRRKFSRADVNHVSDSTYANMQPNLEEVEEQLFISFTSKEALRLHMADSEEPVLQTTPETQPTTETPENAETAESLEERILSLKKMLLRDLKLMKHRQVIHPVLQEVGLKMNLLDPGLAIDLQYLGVRLPLPPPGASVKPLSQELPPPQDVSTAFVSRTGKTTDVTQIKGWREKFSPSDAASTSSVDKPDAAPSSDPLMKNLSAFCSDMLDEYLENEAKLIDERAASFSQAQVEPVVYELPVKSSSYVRTLDSILKKQPSSSPTSDLISGFVPPSKRPKLSLREQTVFRKVRKPRGPKQNKTRPVPDLKQLLLRNPASEEPQSINQKQLKVRLEKSELLSFKRRKKLKPQSSSQTLTAPVTGVSEDMAPLESDSELGITDQDTGPPMTQALLRQKDLEVRVLLDGRPRTWITEERATIALTSLFTLMGFASENPTAPVQLARRWTPPCLNEFCRLGCVCSSLSHACRVCHCGRPRCMFGCSCLKQKVVLLRNLDCSDRGIQQGDCRKRRKRRMKMAYVLKEADSVSQPDERVRTLWNRTGSDSEPLHIPEPGPLPHNTTRIYRLADVNESRKNISSCARVRGFTKKKTTKKQKEMTKHLKTQVVKSVRHKDLKETKSSSTALPGGGLFTPAPKHPNRAAAGKAELGPDSADGPVLSLLSSHPSNPPSELPPKPSKRLIILAECKWASDADRNHVLKKLCEAMAQDRLGNPFWIRKYLISPLCQTVGENGSEHCIQYKVHISIPKVEPEKPAVLPKPQLGPHRDKKTQLGLGWDKTQLPGLDWDKKTQGELNAKPFNSLEEDMKVQQQPEMNSNPQRGVEEEVLKPPQGKEEEMKPLQQQHLSEVSIEAEPPEEWQQQVEEKVLLEDWQQEVGGGDPEEDEGSKAAQVDDGRMNSLGLPFLAGISPAGYLSANRKERGGTDHLVQVNGKLYPLAKIQLGKMGALHPANRLAAYLTGRVGANRNRSLSGPSPQAGSSATPQPQQPVVSTPKVLRVTQSAAGEAPEVTASQLIAVGMYPTPPSGDNQVKRTPDDSRGSAHTDSISTSLVRLVKPPTSKASQVLMVELLGSAGKVPVTAPPSHRMVLQPVRTTSGLRFYRRPDGKLVQLVPITQPTQRLSNPVQRGSGFINHSGPCTYKIISNGSNRKPVVVTCPAVPSQAPPSEVSSSLNLLQSHPKPSVSSVIALKPSPGSGIGVKSVMLSRDSSAPLSFSGVPGGASVSQTSSCVPGAPPAPLTPSGGSIGSLSAHCSSGSPEGPSAPQPPREPTNRLSLPTELELACDPVDLDIVCVDGDTMEVMDRGGSSSSETENSSDFESDDGGEMEITRTNEEKRVIHNNLERRRRGQMKQLFEHLGREVDQSQTSKISTLKKAVQVIQDLRETGCRLQRRKRRLVRKRDHFLSTIAPLVVGSGEIRGLSSFSERRPEKKRVEVDVMEVVDLLDETDEMTDNSSDEERGDKEEELQEEPSLMRSSERSLKETFEAPVAYRGDSSVLDTNAKQVHEEKPRRCLNQQGDTYITETSQGLGEELGKTEQSVQRKPAASQLPGNAGCGACKLPSVTLPPATSTGTLTFQQPSIPVLAPILSSCKAPVLGDKPRTVPNILSRRRNLAPSLPVVTNPVKGEAPSFQPLVQTEVLSLVGASLPGQPVLTLSPLMPGPAVLQTNLTPGLPSVTLNIPGLTNQQIHLASVPRLPAGKIYSCSAPFTVPNFPATNFTNLLQAVQPASEQHLQMQQLQTPQLQTLQTPQLQTLQTPQLQTPQLQTLQTPQLQTQQLQTQQLQTPQLQTLQTPQLQTLQLQTLQTPQLQTPQLQTLQAPQLQTLQLQTLQTPQLQMPQLQTLQTPQLQPQQRQQLPRQQSQKLHPQYQQQQDPVGRLCLPGEPVQVSGTRDHCDSENLTSILDEIVLLNQQKSISMVTQDQDQNTWIQQLDLDSDCGVTNEKEKAGVNGPSSGLAACGNSVLTPPPLLQMNVCGPNVADPAPAAGGGGREGGISWRPMPRLVPLGLRGNQAS